MTRVLIVDDEKSIRNTLSAFLWDEGYTVESAADVEGAKDLLQREKYDVVVSDIILPRASGVTLLQEIRQTAPDIQVIMMTGEPTIETAVEAVRAGACDYLTKPVSKASILRVVANAARIKALEDDKRRLEAENRQYQESLEQLVDRRTSELQESNRRLQAALDDLKQTQQHMIQQARLSALGQMAGGIVHDFNNALMPIVGHTEYFLMHPECLDDREELLNSLKDMAEGARDARDIVHRLREFYKPDDAERLPVNLNEVIGVSIRLTRPKWEADAGAQGFGVKIETKLTKVPQLYGAASQLREVFTNLILNAVDAIADCGKTQKKPFDGKITIETRGVNDYAEITVRDNGAGMPKDAADRCFEPFFTTKGGHGTGLGLAMVHGIVHRHEGSVSVRSEPGNTEFLIRLPAYPTPRRSLEEIDPSPALTRSLRVLLVDDDAASLKMAGQLLRTGGHLIFTARSGREALETFRKGANAPGGDANRFDVVITDRAMTDMSGDLVAAEIKKIDPNVPVILLTGFGEVMKAKNEVPAEVDLVLGKPVTEEDLARAVGTVVRNFAARGTGGEA